VSPWPHRELRVLLAPDRVTLWSVRRAFTLRGVARSFHEARTLPFEGAAERPWQPALPALEAALAREARQRAVATLVVSNQLVRYVLVPWQAELTDPQEELSYARHCFGKVYGKAGQDWELRLSRQAPGLPRVASAIDPALLADVKGVFATAGVGLRSIQPHLMEAFNRARGQLRGRSAWIALFEPGHLCLAMLHEGRWSRVHSQRIGSGWREALLPALERQCFLADEAALPQDVYGATPDDGEPALPDIAPWRFHALAPLAAGADAAAVGGELLVAGIQG
jgi:hypothetical protein